MGSGALCCSCIKSVFRQDAVHYEIESVRVPKERVELYRSKRLSITYDLIEMQKAVNTDEKGPFYAIVWRVALI